jgi:hypothetical protein
MNLNNGRRALKCYEKGFITNTECDIYSIHFDGKFQQLFQKANWDYFVLGFNRVSYTFNASVGKAGFIVIVMKQMMYLMLAVLLATVHSFTYLNQTDWGGSCNDNQLQSPIDIPCQQYLNVCPAAKGYQIYWQNPVVQFGASPYEDIKTFFTNNSWVRYSNETNDYVFKSWQFHFHHPSEHTVNG